MINYDENGKVIVDYDFYNECTKDDLIDIILVSNIHKDELLKNLMDLYRITEKGLKNVILGKPIRIKVKRLLESYSINTKELLK